MTLKNDLEVAKDAVTKALVTALNDKNEKAVKPLMNVYNLIGAINVTSTNVFSINDYGNININSGVGGAGSSDVISFS